MTLAERRDAFDAILNPATNGMFSVCLDLPWYLPIRFSCPCCGYPSLTSRGMTEICPLCEWQDDGRDNAQADLVPTSGCNSPWSLAQARSNFETHGCKYDPSAHYYDQYKAHQHPSMLTAKDRLIAKFEQLLDIDPANKTWMKVWIGVLCCTQDLLYVVGRAREKRWAGKEITAEIRPHHLQPWRGKMLPPPPCIDKTRYEQREQSIFKY